MRHPSRSAVTGFAIATGLGHAAQAERTWSNEAGAYLSYHFGGGARGHLGFGFEVRRMYAQRVFENSTGQCGGVKSAPYAGFAGRLAIFGWDQVHLLIVPQVGLSAVDSSASGGLGAEVGLGYRLGHAYGAFLQPGIEASAGAAVFARGSYAFGRDLERSVPTREGSLDLGARIAPAVTETCFVVGRPLRRGSGRAPLPIAYLGAGSTGPSAREPVPTEKRAHAARLWATRAATEWASIPAFWELGDQLEACGAPRALQQRAIAAAEDEIGHALFAAKLAAVLGGVPLELEPPVLVPRDPEVGRAGLLRLASESWTDGCLGEGAAAACAATEAANVQSPVIRSIQRTVAADEARHAELGWDVLAWALSQANAETAATIRGFATQPPPVSKARSDDHGLEEFGCLSSAAQSSVASRHAVDAAKRFVGRFGV